MRVIANWDILYRGHKYRKGDVIPNAEPSMVEAWLETKAASLIPTTRAAAPVAEDPPADPPKPDEPGADLEGDEGSGDDEGNEPKTNPGGEDKSAATGDELEAKLEGSDKKIGAAPPAPDVTAEAAGAENVSADVQPPPEKPAETKPAAPRQRNRSRRTTAPGAPGKKAGGTGAEGDMVGIPPERK